MPKIPRLLGGWRGWECCWLTAPPETPKLNFHEGSIYVRSTKILLFTSLTRLSETLVCCAICTFQTSGDTKLLYLLESINRKVLMCFRNQTKLFVLLYCLCSSKLNLQNLFIMGISILNER